MADTKRSNIENYYKRRKLSHIKKTFFSKEDSVEERSSLLNNKNEGETKSNFDNSETKRSQEKYINKKLREK